MDGAAKKSNKKTESRWSAGTSSVIVLYKHEDLRQVSHSRRYKPSEDHTSTANDVFLFSSPQSL